MSVLLWLGPVLLPVLAAVLLAARPGPRTSWLLVAAPAPAINRRRDAELPIVRFLHV